MTRIYSFVFGFSLIIALANGQDATRKLSIGLGGGVEGIANYHYSGHSFTEFHNNGTLSFGIIETYAIDNVDLFISQYYSHVKISEETELTNHTISLVNYFSSNLIVPVGLNVRLSKSEINYLFLSGAYRLEFIFDQKRVDRYREVKESKFSLARQTVEIGPGVNIYLSDAIQIKLKTMYVFIPFFCENNLLADVSDSRINLTVSVLKKI